MSLNDAEKSSEEAPGIDSQALSKELDFWFNERSDGCVILVTGDWGVGKTFAWNAFRTQHSFEKYASVSLFGLRSVDQIERSLLSQLPLAGKTSFFKKFKSDTSKVGEAAEELIRADFGKVGNSAIAVATELVFAKNRGATIMLDDLERSCDELKVKAVLGIVAKLRERYGMRIAILTNEEKLDDAAWHDFKEKVVDAQFLLLTAPRVAASLGFTRCKWAANASGEFAERVELTNIRLFQRADTFLDRLKLDPSKHTTYVLDRLANSVIALAWARFCPGKDVPTPEMMVSRSWMTDTFSKKDGESRDPKVEMLSHLHWNPDAMDRWVNNAWASGLGSVNEFLLRLREYEDDNAQLEANAARSEAWDKYRNQLLGGETEIATAFLRAHTKYAERYTIGQLSSDVTFLKNIEQFDTAAAIIRIHETRWSDNNWSQQQITSSLESIDSDIKASILKRPSVESKEPFLDWLKRLAKSNSWGSEDTRRARAMSAVEWENGLSCVTGADWLVDAIGQCRRVIAFGVENERKSNTGVSVETMSGLDEFLLKLQKSDSPLTRDRATRLLAS